MSRNALIVRHVPYEGIAAFRAPLQAAGYELDRIDVTDPSFARADFITPDLVVLMGGPMGVYDHREHPWIAREIERLEERLDNDRPTIGVCLGAQMIAAALGADVYAAPEKEIGFAPLALTDSGEDSPLRHLAGTPVLHWHGDTFDLPRGTERLASTPLTPNQAFRRGKTVLGLQCHAEMGLDPRIEHWIETSPDSLAALGLDGESIRAQYREHGPRCVLAGQVAIAEWLDELQPDGVAALKAGRLRNGAELPLSS